MDKILENYNEVEEDTQLGRYLIFLLSKEKYGIEISYVTEIVGIQEITEMPDIPAYIKGIINLRGKIIPLMDVRLRFCKEDRTYDDRTCVIVINCNGVDIGLIVDSVSEVQTIQEDDISVPPNINSSVNNRYIKNIGKIGSEVVLVLDCEKILSADEIEAVVEIA